MRADDLERIAGALDEAAAVLRAFAATDLVAESKGAAGPVTAADREVDALLRDRLVRPGEGWLSEETEDDPARLDCQRVWVVDPLDGTHELLAGVPEWCVSIGLVEDGVAVAGGICNPVADLSLVGSVETGLLRDGAPVVPRPCAELADAVVLSSRSETARGEWDRFTDAGFQVKPTGSVAYKLGLVAAGEADATWTLTPKHEWDVAAGVALITAVGGRVRTLAGDEPRFNKPRPRFEGMIATSAATATWFDSLLFRLGPDGPTH